MLGEIGGGRKGEKEEEVLYIFERSRSTVAENLGNKHGNGGFIGDLFARTRPRNDARLVNKSSFAEEAFLRRDFAVLLRLIIIGLYATASGSPVAVAVAARRHRAGNSVQFARLRLRLGHATM